MKQICQILILCVTVLIAVSFTNAETIPLDKGNVWIYSYTKKDSSRTYEYRRIPGLPDSIYHYSGILSLTIDSIKSSNSSNDTTFFWLAVIDSGIIQNIGWDSKRYRNVKNLRFLYLENRIIFPDTTILINYFCPLTYELLPDAINYVGIYSRRETASSNITIGNKEFTVYSTEVNSSRSHSMEILKSFEKHLWISQIGTAHWSLDYYSYNNGQAKRELSEFFLQSFNGNSIQLAINPRVISKTPLNPANQIFQKSIYLIGNRTTSQPISLNSYFTIQGQKAIRTKSSQLFVQCKDLK